LLLNFTLDFNAKVTVYLAVSVVFGYACFWFVRDFKSEVLLQPRILRIRNLLKGRVLQSC